MKWRSANSSAGTLASLLGNPFAPKRGHGSPAPRLSDEQVMEARRLHERQGYDTRRVLKHFCIETTPNKRLWMAGILAYRFRSSPTKPLDPDLGR